MKPCSIKECCCRCRYQHPVYCHPWNSRVKQARGRCVKVFGWICDMFTKCMPKEGGLIFMDRKHGRGCEMFDEKKVKIND